jgi:hypothetical protein
VLPSSAWLCARLHVAVFAASDVIHRQRNPATIDHSRGIKPDAVAGFINGLCVGRGRSRPGTWRYRDGFSQRPGLRLVHFFPRVRSRCPWGVCVKTRTRRSKSMAEGGVSFSSHKFPY